MGSFKVRQAAGQSDGTCEQATSNGGGMLQGKWEKEWGHE